jgi:hypothetical protein
MGCKGLAKYLVASTIILADILLLAYLHAYWNRSESLLQVVYIVLIYIMRNMVPDNLGTFGACMWWDCVLFITHPCRIVFIQSLLIDSNTKSDNNWINPIVSGLTFKLSYCCPKLHKQDHGTPPRFPV